MALTFSDTLQPAQIKQHLALPFDVPAGTQGIHIDFEYAPGQVNGRNNLLTLTLFDPQQVRGEGHKHDPHQEIQISPVDATPGYLAGDMPPGEWTLVINTHMILAPVTFRLTIELADSVPDAALRIYTPARIKARGRGWYRGDLHGHTFHSDGHWHIPDLLAYARDEQLDFVTLSDHNTVAGLPQMDALADDDLLTMGGMELTTFYGHALALGVRNWIDWRVQAGMRTMSDAVREVAAAGGLFVIAHPMALGDPVCTGCDWQYRDVMPGEARVVEIWNGPWDDDVSRNEEALRLWYQWLNQGYRMVATTGSDIHGLPADGTRYGRDVVYAETLSESAILDAVRRGHLYLSSGPRLDLLAEVPDGQIYMMGDAMDVPRATFIAAWADVPAGSHLRWIVNGDVRGESALHAGQPDGAEFEVMGDAWVLVEIRDASGGLLAITNPIFMGGAWG